MTLKFKKWPLVFLSLIVTQPILAQQQTTIDNKEIFGRLELISLPEVSDLNGVSFNAKIDTGADTTSMHATNIHIVSDSKKWKGKQDTELLKAIARKFGSVESEWWLKEFDNEQRKINAIVTFDIRHPLTGEIVKIQKPLSRISTIKSRSSDEPFYRPVVKMNMAISGESYETDVNLTDRSNFSTPILVGKTLLKKNAWVNAGYDYLQHESKYTDILYKNEAKIATSPLKVSTTFDSKYSSLHALNVKVNEETRMVSFDSVDAQGKKIAMSKPLIRNLKFSGNSYPMVYVPISFGNDFSDNILVYLKDRSERSTQLRLGRNVQSRHFNILFSKDNKNESLKTLTLSPNEIVKIDTVEVLAQPSPYINTSILELDDYSIDTTGDEYVRFTLVDKNGYTTTVSKLITKKITVGDEERPVIEQDVYIGGEKYQAEIALRKEPNSNRLLIGKSFPANVEINTRTNYLQSKNEIIKAGYVEKVKVDSISLAAKLDTGADVSSISATNIKEFTKDKEQWVSFTYSNSDGLAKEISKKVIDMMNVKARSGEKAPKRYVVSMNVSLAGVTEEIEVNLRDRTAFAYSMILGKNFLDNNIIVSSDDRFLLK